MMKKLNDLISKMLLDAMLSARENLFRVRLFIRYKIILFHISAGNLFEFTFKKNNFSFETCSTWVKLNYTFRMHAETLVGILI